MADLGRGGEERDIEGGTGFLILFFPSFALSGT
ncbi:hypothetical protein ACVIJ6_002173 [Bradyrhizobium sp. USDA 4369]